VTNVFAWADCTLDAKQHTLVVSGKLVHLAPRYFDVLLCLVRRADQLVTKRELLETVWPGQTVSDASLHTAVMVVRRSLKCGVSYPIETVSTVGYRFNMGRRS
jgi:DNA-binding winged helix-turn-helix (wHTH) protein